VALCHLVRRISGTVPLRIFEPPSGQHDVLPGSMLCPKLLSQPGFSYSAEEKSHFSLRSFSILLASGSMTCNLMISTTSLFDISDSSFSMSELWTFLTIHIFMAYFPFIMKLTLSSAFKKIWNPFTNPATSCPDVIDLYRGILHVPHLYRNMF
jgi:hypothetical protein